jgi:hypothetical protein
MAPSLAVSGPATQDVNMADLEASDAIFAEVEEFLASFGGLNIEQPMKECKQSQDTRAQQEKSIAAIYALAGVAVGHMTAEMMMEEQLASFKKAIRRLRRAARFSVKVQAKPSFTRSRKVISTKALRATCRANTKILKKRPIRTFDPK